MKHVASANYMDRSDKVNRWMVRGVEQEISEAETKRSVILENFLFVRSTDERAGNKGENGFGCSVVVVGDVLEEEVTIEGENIRPLAFESLSGCFKDAETQDYVTSGKLLLLRVDGAALYIPSSPVAKD